MGAAVCHGSGLLYLSPLFFRAGFHAAAFLSGASVTSCESRIAVAISRPFFVSP